jgi:hypothetical protein
MEVKGPFGVNPKFEAQNPKQIRWWLADRPLFINSMLDVGCSMLDVRLVSD